MKIPTGDYIYIKQQMKKQRYSIIMNICMVLCLPIAILQWYFYFTYRKQENEYTKARLERSLLLGLGFIFFEILIICFLFYQFGRQLIHVMGTFY